MSDTVSLEGRTLESNLKTPWHALAPAAVLDQLGSGMAGLASAEVELRRERYGENQITTSDRPGVIKRFLNQFNNILIYILLGSAVITIVLERFVDTSVILGVVILNAIFGFIQEGKAEKALLAIREMLAPNANVIRDGNRIIIPASSLVPGDIVLIKSGDKVPADLRLLEVKNLQLQEAILTGESLPVEKRIDQVLETAAIPDHFSIAYGGTLVVSGRGIGVVIATGDQTEVGKTSAMISQVPTIITPLLRQINVFGRWLTLAIIVMAIVTLLFGVLVWGDATAEMFMAVVGLTVAAIPEGLPAILTIILAIGVTRMAKQNAIVRRLPIVEVMGSVTTICTDKTGTLTRNEQVVQSIVTATSQYHDIGNEFFVPTLTTRYQWGCREA